MVLLNGLDLRSWLRLEDSEWFWVILGILSAAVFLLWIYFQAYAKGIRDSKKWKIRIIALISLILILIGVFGYGFNNKFGYILEFLQGYDELLYSVLILSALALVGFILLFYWSEIKWQRRIRARSEQLKKETEIVRKNVEGVETKEEEVQEYFAKTEKDIGKFRDVYEEFQKG
jgi:hypothetical protein